MAYNTNVVLENTADGYVAEGKSIKGSYFVIDTLANIPNSMKVKGAKVYNQADDSIYIYNGSTWVVDSTGGTNVEANPTIPSGTTPTNLKNVKIGNSYYKVPTELPAFLGNAGKILKVNSLATGVEWGTAEYTAGDNIAISGQNAISVSSGNAAAGKVMTANGSGGATWENPTASLTNPMVDEGDMIIGGVSGAPKRLNRNLYDAGMLVCYDDSSDPEWIRENNYEVHTNYTSNNEIVISYLRTKLSATRESLRLTVVIQVGSDVYTPIVVLRPYNAISQDSSSPTHFYAKATSGIYDIMMKAYWDTSTGDLHFSFISNGSPLVMSNVKISFVTDLMLFTYY